MGTWLHPGWRRRQIVATNQTKARTRRMAQNLVYVTIDPYLFGVSYTIFVVLKEFIRSSFSGRVYRRRVKCVLLAVVGWAEPQRACDYAVEGYVVFHSPRCLTCFSKKKDGFSILLRGQTLNFGPTWLTDDVPPETVSICPREARARCSE